MTALPLEGFGPVTLDELVTDAALLTRVDRKYIVPARDAARLLAALDPATRVLEIDGSRDFAYESVYFDTPDLLSFRMAAQPRRRRFKLRTRSYLDTDAAYLEIKTRGARGTTVKERTEYDPRSRRVLTDGARDDIADAFDAIGVDGDRAGELAATLTTRYRRTTLLASDGLGRATIDTHLRWDEPGGAGFALPEVVIVETKSPAAASRIDRLLWRAGHRPATVSKYATGLAALHADLPHNRWNRVLRGPFSTRTTLPARTDARTEPARTEELPCAAA
ncbi:VTC domain-containing protein [Microbacterium sp. SS28]|uniref:VTC domain-containing protein n=1 Tax=Microbacterium sp. SS28 TaxID=2919948 RepID=UPI001FAB0B66|nr:VTC domain-containing protein [Microbacterium sp. SS28]